MNQAVAIAVRENDLHPILANIPKNWQKNLVLIQNELLPLDWQCYDFPSPQQYLIGGTLNNEQLTKAMLVAFEADLEHSCIGRSAPARLTRALQIADNAGLTVNTLQQIANSGDSL